MTGVVQGVGFRPFSHRLATELCLAGHVGNDAGGVFIEVEGPASAVESFEARLAQEAPPLCRIHEISSMPLEPIGERAFEVVESLAGSQVSTFVPPDVATCSSCLRELFDPRDRRYRHPFINCTDCGPRFTITVRLPYDRRNTTMAGFAMCRSCEKEYQDPADRRFHAQPIACPDCGPELRFVSARGEVAAGDGALAAAQICIAAGRVVAVKGIGGYHLCCDATSDAAVKLLRSRKRRAEKPFAVMVRDLEGARRFARPDDEESKLLSRPERPIVLLCPRSGAVLSEAIAPGSPRLGVMLAYSPLHHLLFAPVPGFSTPVPECLVMTSGNLSEEPICYRDDDARERLAPLVDAWLTHDRDIHVPCDDSVAMVVDGVEVPLRRSRGYVPLPVWLPEESGTLLATGGEMKNAFCLARGRQAWMSQHIGDMGSLETLEAFERAVEHLGELYGAKATRVVTDMHPSYLVGRWGQEWAQRKGTPLGIVQHHHAHLASVMVENEMPRDSRAVGFVFDGTGYGMDGTVWGGEVLVGGYASVERAAHLRCVPLPGGDAAVRAPYRMALAHLRASGVDWDDDLPPVRIAKEAGELAALERQLVRNVGCVQTSSVGRLFDAVSALLGFVYRSTYEGHAAVVLEAAALSGVGQPGTEWPDLHFDLTAEEFDPSRLLATMVAELRQGRPRSSLAADFHSAVARLVGDLGARLCASAGLDVVALSGGVFQNALLLSLVKKELAGLGLRAITHRMVPPNDGGLALGQVAVAVARWRSGSSHDH